MNARRLSGALLALSLVGLAGCTSSADTGGTPSASSTTSSSGTTSSTPTPDPSASASDAALAAYRGYRAAQVKALTTLDLKASGLSTYAADKAFTDVGATLLLFQQQGLVMKGQPQSAPSVESVTLGATPTAVVTDCFDTSGWEAVHAATGESAVAPGQARRTWVRATLSVYAGRCVVRTVTNEKDRTC